MSPFTYSKRKFQMKKLLTFAAIACACWMLASPLLAQEVVTVSSCPDRPALPVTFVVDCSHVADAATKQLCRPFAENQACKVFWAYRSITGIHLEEKCPTFKYTIYDRDKFPHQQGEGGLALHCGADYMADYSLLINDPKFNRSKRRSDIGPFDVHEILHGYQERIAPLPYVHVLFSSSMLEAEREVGDQKLYEFDVDQRKEELQHIETGFEKGTIPADKQCQLAEEYVEMNLYFKDPKNLEQFYRRLEPGGKNDVADPWPRFLRMLDAVSGGSAKQYLLAHCPRF